jgi:hypothetical protein
MRLRPRLLLLSFVVTSSVAAAAAAQSPCAHWKGGELQLAGRVGSADVAVYLDGQSTSERETVVTGLIMFSARWRADSGDKGLAAFHGPVQGCNLKLAAMRGEGEWDLDIVAPTRIEGTRRTSNGTEPVALTVTPPLDCTAGPWRTFSRPDWPMTFEYPASARVTGTVAIACPEITVLDGGNTLSIAYQPTSTQRLERGRDRQKIGPFISDAPGQWFVDDRDRCGPNPVVRDDSLQECRAATVSQWRGFTVIQGRSSGVYRVYRPGGGGYLGIGEGLGYYAVLVGDGAMLITSDDPDQILGGDQPDHPDDHNATRMAKRIVRSLKRR